MKEINAVYRGKVVGSNTGFHHHDWMYGNLVEELSTGKVFICDLSHFDSDTKLVDVMVEVDPETVGQYTGLKDKNDKEIYEGDIVIMHQFLFDGTEYENEIKGVVVYNTDAIAYCLTKVNNDKIREDTLYNQEEFDQVEIPICMFYGLHDESWDIIGNIHDNPELLEEKVNE